MSLTRVFFYVDRLDAAYVMINISEKRCKRGTGRLEMSVLHSARSNNYHTALIHL